MDHFGHDSTSDGGGVAGYVEDHRLENGASATFALPDYIRYYNVNVANTIDGFAVNVAVAPVAATTVYTNVNSGLSGATGGETTSHTYYFNPSTSRSNKTPRPCRPSPMNTAAVTQRTRRRRCSTSRVCRFGSKTPAAF